MANLDDSGSRGDLGRRLHAGDELALGQIYDLYRKPLFATALALLGDRHLAEEAVQETMIRVWQAAKAFDPDRALAPWLYQIVRRCAIDLYRRESRSAANAPLEEIPLSQQAEEQVSVDHLWLAWTLRAALDELPVSQREAVHLVHCEGLSYHEVAERQRVPVGTIKSRVSRGARRLEQVLTSGGHRDELVLVS